MARGRKVVEVPEDAAEDEILAANGRGSGFDPVTLDEFLGEQFQTSTKESNGMPPLDWLKSKLKTKSAAIRYLHHKKFTVNQISKHLGLRYQHVRNVLTTELKRGPNEPFKIDDYAAPGVTSHLDPTNEEDNDAEDSDAE